jgi:NAD(P)H-flavin reductase
VNTFTARVSKLSDLTYDVRVLELELLDPPRIDFRAGQFISFQVPIPNARFPLTRVYSICSAPRNDSVIELLYNLVPNGPGSSFLHALAEGDQVTFKGPTGTFVVRDDDRDLLLVATSTGIAPLRSILLEEVPAGRRVQLVWGNRTAQDLYYERELRDLAAAHPNFSVVLLLSRPDSEWNGRRGFVHDWLQEYIGDDEPWSAFLCGGSGMLRAAADVLRAKRVARVVKEQYYKGTELD